MNNSNKKVVINSRAGGFRLSIKAIIEYLKRKNINIFFYIFKIAEMEKKLHIKVSPEELENLINNRTPLIYDIVIKDFGEILTFEDFYKIPKEYMFYPREIKRDDPDLVYIVESLGKEAADNYCNLKIVEIPNDVKFIILSDDSGEEWIAEEHRTWE